MTKCVALILLSRIIKNIHLPSRFNAEENDSVENVTGRTVEDRSERLFVTKDTDKTRTVHARITSDNVNSTPQGKEVKYISPR